MFEKNNLKICPRGHHLGGPYLENSEKKFQRNFG